METSSITSTKNRALTSQIQIEVIHSRKTILGETRMAFSAIRMHGWKWTFLFFIMKMDFYLVTTSSRNKYVKDRYEWRGGSFVDENEWPKSNRKEHLENPIPNFPSHTPKCKREREWEALSLLERREMYSAGASSYPHVKKYKETNYPPSFYFWSSCFPFHRLFFFFL